MLAGDHNLTFEQGADFTVTVILYQDEARTLPVNLTGYTAKMKVKTADLGTTRLDSTAATSTIGLALGGAAGTVVVTVTAARTLVLVPGEALRWDLELVSAGGTVTRWLQGEARVDAGVTL